MQGNHGIAYYLLVDSELTNANNPSGTDFDRKNCKGIHQSTFLIVYSADKIFSEKYDSKDYLDYYKNCSFKLIN